MARLDSKQNVAQLIKQVVIDLSKVHPQVQSYLFRLIIFQYIAGDLIGSFCFVILYCKNIILRQFLISFTDKVIVFKKKMKLNFWSKFIQGAYKIFFSSRH